MKKILMIVIMSNILYAGSYAALLFHGNCITCHAIKENKSAPSIFKVQQAYKNAFRNEKEFVEYMANWVDNPKAKTSLMHDDIEKYGLMPHLAYDKEVLKEIAAFIYRTDFNSYTH